MKRRAALLGLASPLALAAPPSTGGSHFKVGGFNDVTHVRTRVGAIGTKKMFKVLSLVLPEPHLLYMMPHTAAALAQGLFWQESAAELTVGQNGQLVVNTPGLWRITACADWPGQRGTDINNRKLTIWRVPVGVEPPRYTPGKLTAVQNLNDYDRLASQDSPASDVPQYLRATVAWQAVTLQPGQYASVRVPMPASSQVSIQGGDFAQAAIDVLTDAVIGAGANEGLRLDARVVGFDLVLVRLTNEGSAPVSVPGGNLDVLAGTSVATTGNSADAWTTLAASDEYLLQNESIFITWCSETPGDWIQCTGMTYVQMELLAT